MGATATAVASEVAGVLTGEVATPGVAGVVAGVVGGLMRASTERGGAAAVALGGVGVPVGAVATAGAALAPGVDVAGDAATRLILFPVGGACAKVT